MLSWLRNAIRGKNDGTNKAKRTSKDVTGNGSISPRGSSGAEEAAFMQSTLLQHQGLLVYQLREDGTYDHNNGKMLFDLSQLPIGKPFITPKGNQLMRINETDIRLGDHMLYIPSDKTKVFGAPLDMVLKNEGSKLPSVIVQAVEYLEQRGLDTEGLFRVPGEAREIRKLKDEIDRGRRVDFSKLENHHTVASLIKQYLRELPYPLLTRQLHKEFLGVPSYPDREEKIRRVVELIARLPPANRRLLLYIIKFLLRVVAHAEQNKMNVSNVAMVVGPCFVDSGNGFAEMGQVAQLAALLIEEYDGITAALKAIPGLDDENNPGMGLAVYVNGHVAASSVTSEYIGTGSEKGKEKANTASSWGVVASAGIVPHSPVL